MHRRIPQICSTMLAQHFYVFLIWVCSPVKHINTAWVALKNNLRYIIHLRLLFIDIGYLISVEDELH